MVKKSLISILTSRINALNKVASYSSFKNRKMIANGVVMKHITVVWRMQQVPTVCLAGAAEQGHQGCYKVGLVHTD